MLRRRAAVLPRPIGVAVPLPSRPSGTIQTSPGTPGDARGSTFERVPNRTSLS